MLCINSRRTNPSVRRVFPTSVAFARSTRVQCPDFHSVQTTHQHCRCTVYSARALFAAARCKFRENSRKIERCEHDDPSDNTVRIAKLFTLNCSAIQYASNDTFSFFVRRPQSSRERVPWTLPKNFAPRDSQPFQC